MKSEKAMKYRTIIKNLLIILLTIVVISISVIGLSTLTGEGMSFNSIFGEINTRKAFQYIKKGEYEKATNYIGFHGYSEDRKTIDIKNIEDEKSRFVEGLINYFNENNRALTSYSDIEFITDDGFTTGTIKLEIKDSGDLYSFTLTLASYGGKVYPMYYSDMEEDNEYTRKTKKLAEELVKIIRTYNPG